VAADDIASKHRYPRCNSIRARDDTIRIGNASGSLTAIDAVVRITRFDVFRIGATVPTDRASGHSADHGPIRRINPPVRLALIDPANLEGMMFGHWLLNLWTGPTVANPLHRVESGRG